MCAEKIGAPEYTEIHNAEKGEPKRNPNRHDIIVKTKGLGASGFRDGPNGTNCLRDKIIIRHSVSSGRGCSQKTV